MSLDSNPDYNMRPNNLGIFDCWIKTYESKEINFYARTM